MLLLQHPRARWLPPRTALPLRFREPEQPTPRVDCEEDAWRAAHREERDALGALELAEDADGAVRPERCLACRGAEVPCVQETSVGAGVGEEAGAERSKPV